jgi:ATP-dependent DNA helicase RecG
MPRPNYSIELFDITGAERDRLLTLDEDHFGDLKSREIEPKKLANTICAFANAAGGDLYVGIGEDEILGTKVRTWHGFKDIEAANGHLQSLEEVFPLGSEYAYDFLRSAGSSGLVLHIQVQRTTQISKTHNGNIYVRRGAHNHPLKTPEEINRLRLDKGIDSFETQTVDADVSLVSESSTLIQFMKHVVPALAPITFLRKQSLIKSQRLTVSAVLLFADEPQAVLPKRSAVKLYRYKTANAVGTRETLVEDPQTIEGPVYDLIRDAVAATVKMIEGIQKLGPSGLENVNYPHETLHEIVTNAVLHRDYSIAADVQVRVFDNRVEVESPGLFPGHVTSRNFLDEQFARNGSLVRLINKFPNPPNKDVGEGLNTAFKAMQKLRLKPPIVTETENSVLVKIRHDPLASPEESVMDYLQNHEQITNRIARELTGITSENSMKEVFIRLNKRDLIERVPDKRGAAAAWHKKSIPE